MFENFFEGPFGRPKSLTPVDRKAVGKLMVCTDPDKMEDDFEELYTTLVEMSEKPTFDDDAPDYEIITDAIRHYQEIMDNRTVDEFIRDWVYTQAGMAPSPEAKESELMRYFPDEYSKQLPKNGGWIMIKRDVPVPGEFRPVVYSVYFAKPAAIYKDIEISSTARRKQRKKRIPYYRVRITTPAGDVWVWPHEYMIIPDASMLLEEIGNSFDLERMGGDANYDIAKVHYLSTRGLSQTDTYSLLLNSLNSTNHIYFKIREGAVAFWEHYIHCLDRGISGIMALRLWNEQFKELPVVTL